MCPSSALQKHPPLLCHRLSGTRWDCICNAYDEIYNLCQFNNASLGVSSSQCDGWLGQAVFESARIAHAHYDRLIEIYTLPRGSVDPPRGLTKEARRILSELFDLAQGGWAAVLTRIAATANLIPEMSLTMSTLIASIDVPSAWVVK